MKLKKLIGMELVAGDKQIVYLAGKVTGLPYADVEAKFERKQRELEAIGYYVINPVQLVHEEAEWREAMRICISYLPRANYICLLHDWQESKGANFEKMVADRLGISVLA